MNKQKEVIEGLLIEKRSLNEIDLLEEILEVFGKENTKEKTIFEVTTDVLTQNKENLENLYSSHVWNLNDTYGIESRVDEIKENINFLERIIKKLT